VKLTARTIPDFLRQPDKQAIATLIYGPDEGLVRERAQILQTALLGPKPDPLQRVELEEDALKGDPALLADALGAMSLMGGRQVVVLRAQADIGKIVAQALEAAPSPNYLIILGRDLTPRSALRQLFETEANLAALPCYKDEAGDVTNVLRAILSEAQVQADAEALAYLAGQLGNDRQVTRAEADKLALYAGPSGRITLEDAQALVGNNKDINFEAIALAAAEGDAPRLDALLQQAWSEAATPVAVLRSAARHFHRLYWARARMAGGESAEQAVAALKPAVFFRQVPSVTRQLQRWNQADLARALSLLAEGEAACKGAPGAPTLLCSQTLLTITLRGRALAKVAA